MTDPDTGMPMVDINGNPMMESTGMMQPKMDAMGMPMMEWV